MNLQPMPLIFVLKQTSINWQEALWGYEHQWLGWKDLVDLAVNKISIENSNNPKEIKLAGLNKNHTEEIGELIRELAGREVSSLEEEVINKKWLFLAQAWLYENKSQFSNLLQVIAEVAASFGYYEETRKFIHFMPVEAGDGFNPQEHTLEECETRLLNFWREYLDKSKIEFGK